ncbi:MAG: PSD1 domain-containing protein, partial [Planctomycetales bacterium]|nr:PSD1 domain-containing protein [Planctomycetales bacterium]
VLAMALMGSGRLWGQTEPTPSGQDDLFVTRVAPILVRSCLACHRGEQAEGGLDLASRTGMLAGGESGEVIDPSDAERSLLWTRVRDDEMPPNDHKLSAEERESLLHWVRDGANWSIEQLDPFSFSSDQRAGYDWWSLRPIVAQSPPTVADDAWSRGPVDRFILERLEARGLSPVEAASRRVLGRRVAFDLTGLPLDSSTLERFLADPRPDAYERLVDRLLASPALGERWGRHWLDVVRYGESQGYERNRIRENAWRYRDWVIAAMNQGLPFDDFVKLQLAGDVIEPGDYSATIATGYHVIGTWDQVAFLEGSSAMQAVARQDHVEDLVATFGQAFVGVTVQCARCHDHKYDPVAQADYYRIAAALAGVWQNEKEAENVRLAAPAQVGLAAGAGDGFVGSAHLPSLRQPAVTHVLGRGRLDQPLDPIAPGVLSAVRLTLEPRIAGSHVAVSADLVPSEPPELSLDASDAERRRRLADWVTDPRNPLTPRVIVNRWWHYHFTVGLVDTPSDFGFAGGRPSHPDLLDWLAAQLVQRDWDLKWLHRELVTSSTYRLASTFDPEAARIDTDARLRWRAPLRALEGEAVRDAMLDAAGLLNRNLGGPSYRDVTVKLNNNHEFTDPNDEITADTCRRTVYRLWARSGNLPLLQSLDCPDPAVMAPRRLGTITPLQALSLQNGALAHRCAESLAERVRRECGDDIDARIVRLWELTLQRPPTAEESDAAKQLIASTGLTQLCLALFNSGEFAFVD